MGTAKYFMQKEDDDTCSECGNEKINKENNEMYAFDGEYVPCFVCQPEKYKEDIHV